MSITEVPKPSRMANKIRIARLLEETKITTIDADSRQKQPIKKHHIFPMIFAKGSIANDTYKRSKLKFTKNLIFLLVS